MAASRTPAPKVRFSQDLFDRICGEIADGKSVREICKGKGMPDRGTFMDWSNRTPELKAQYDKACLDREEFYFEQIIDIADNVRKGVVKTVTETGDGVETKVVHVDMVERARVQIDARKWCLARMNRKKYGDLVSNEHSGPDGGPIETKTQVVRLRMTPVEELPE